MKDSILNSKEEPNSKIPSKAFASWKKLLITLTILGVVYSNLWIIAARSPLSEAVKLPYQIPILKDAFDIFSVFSYYETINRDFLIKGLPKNRYGQYDGETWVTLDVNDEYFPYSLGEQQMRLFLAKFLNLGDEAHLKACKDLAAKIRNRHNKDVPIYQMRQISINIETWPRSTKSYRELKQRDSTSFQVLCMEDE
ncbi:MAG: hypothetical protein SFU25_01040 [Candidatus Caenarcaniphilales bacterium]|nr:hypothetical protein [Candidatus Caenarcaniphilales bacterium]